MPDFFPLFVGSAFLAGLFTFFAPCTLPLIPAFLGVIAGVDQNDLKDPTRSKLARRKIFINAVFYTLGFSIIFILLGAAFSVLSMVLAVKDALQQVGGLFIIFFGLYLAGFLKIPWLSSKYQIQVSGFFGQSSYFNSFIIGALFALGWSPCIGPLLGSILFLASGTDTVLQGLLLLSVFSLGLAIPFLIVAFFIGKAVVVISRSEGWLKFLNTAAGIFLIILGALLISGKFGAILGSFQAYFLTFPRWEEFLNRFF